MELRNINIVKSPLNAGNIRLEGEISYDGNNRKSEVYWFEMSEKYKDFISDSGNPWLACLIPLAVTLGEPLRISLPVDDVLLKNINNLMQIWKSWYPHLHIVPIETNTVELKNIDGSSKTAAFFSGGVDSFFTALRHNASTVSPIVIDDLLYVWGFDIPLENVDAFRHMKNTLRKASDALNKNFIDIATNLRATRWKQTDWGYLSHGCALASVALTLERRFSRVLIASTSGYANTSPWGSHVYTDPLLSTSKIKIVHDGAECGRIEKIEFIAKSEVARHSLHVCYLLGSDKNCSKCPKCYRTMMALDLYGVLEYFKTFDINNYSITTASKIYLGSRYYHLYMNEIRELALRKDRMDMVEAVDRSFQHSERLSKYMPIAKKVEKYLNNKPFVWRWADLMAHILLLNSISNKRKN